MYLLDLLLDMPSEHNRLILKGGVNRLICREPALQRLDPLGGY
jgi:hypothetical protein